MFESIDVSSTSVLAQDLRTSHAMVKYVHDSSVRTRISPERKSLSGAWMLCINASVSQNVFARMLGVGLRHPVITSTIAIVTSSNSIARLPRQETLCLQRTLKSEFLGSHMRS